MQYLTKKENKSNRGTPQCIAIRCKSAVVPSQVIPEECIPFKITLGVFDPAEYEKIEGDKDSINLNLNLVLLRFVME